MGRNDYALVTVNCAKGINEQLNLADPKLECADALNVWAPNGAITTRPGFKGVFAHDLTKNGAVSVGSAAADYLLLEQSGVFTTVTVGDLDLTTMAVGNCWYIGFTDNSLGSANGFICQTSTANAASAVVSPQYWNGTEWEQLYVTEFNGTLVPANNNPTRSTVHLKAAVAEYNYFLFPGPADLAATSVNSISRYWVRFRLIEGSLTAGTAVTLSSIKVIGDNAYTASAGDPDRLNASFVGLFAGQFLSDRKRYIHYLTHWKSSTNQTLRIHNSATLTLEDNVRVDSVAATGLDHPPVFTVIPEFGEIYCAYDNQTLVHKELPNIADTLPAVVETNAVIVGSGAKYDATVIQQLAAWPLSKFITYYRGELWVGNTSASPYEIRWSAPNEYNRVWPLLNQTEIVEDDNSPITAMVGFQDCMTVFKNDSIWQMVDTGASDLGLQTYAPRCVVKGVGCVAQGSVQEIRGKLVFAGEDGIYLFDGTPNIKKISDRVQDKVARMSKSQRAFMASVHWRTKSLYLLAYTSVGDETNTDVLVWDYKNDAWWHWNDSQYTHDINENVTRTPINNHSFNPVVFLSDEDSLDEEVIYFGDRLGRIFELDVGKNDGGLAILSFVLTQRLGFDGITKKLRLIEADCSNLTASADIEVLSNEMPAGSGTFATFTFDDDKEVTYGNAVDGTSQYVTRRDRLRGKSYLEGGEKFQAKVYHQTKNAPLYMNSLTFGFVQQGRRK